MQWEKQDAGSQGVSDQGWDFLAQSLRKSLNFTKHPFSFLLKDEKMQLEILEFLFSMEILLTQGRQLMSMMKSQQADLLWALIPKNSSAVYLSSVVSNRIAWICYVCKIYFGKIWVRLPLCGMVGVKELEGKILKHEASTTRKCPLQRAPSQPRNNALC